MKFTVVTILPELVEPALAAGVVGRAREAGTIEVTTINPRDFTSDRHRSVDDTPYGGGPGMVMKPEPLLAAIAAASGPAAGASATGASATGASAGASAEASAGASGGASMAVASTPGPSDGASTTGASSTGASTTGASTTGAQPAGTSPASVAVPAVPTAQPPHRILMTPAGTPLTQARVRELAQLPHIVLVCGRYEGIDERVIETAIDEQLSIGDYVLSGGELAALVVIDAVARLVPGVLGEPTSADDESHSAGLLEYPQYTRPAKLDEREVPTILMSGNHAAIAAWRRRQAIERTAQRRPDLFARFVPAKADRIATLAARTYVALVHHPVVDRTGKLVTTALTNFDIHDLARSTRTYGLGGYYIVTPITSQREKAEHVVRLWMEESDAPADETSGSRAAALALVKTAESVEAVIGELTAAHGTPPLVVASSARRTSFPDAARRTPDELRAEATLAAAPVLLLLGTGWGLADHLIPSVSRVLAPIEGASDWNHLSVRSAGAILLDRLFGRSANPST